MSFTTDAARWRALSIRDPNANGHFVYTVKSTCIYCRPTCPARLARRANIGFCKTPAEAEAAGFRACKRCKPDAETNEDPQAKAVGKACALIEEALKLNDAKALRLQDLAKSVGLTPRYFHKIFKDNTGLTPKEYAKSKMLQRKGVDAATLSPEGTMDLEPFNLEAFDFNDLVDFNVDASLSMDDTLVLAMAEPPMPGMFGNEIDVNIQPLVTTAFRPNAVDAGLSFGDDKPFKWIDTTTISDAAMIATTATFEHDAALVLSGGMFPELTTGLYRDTFV